MACLAHGGRKESKLLARRENLLVPDDRTGVFSSPEPSVIVSVMCGLLVVLLAAHSITSFTLHAVMHFPWIFEEKRDCSQSRLAKISCRFFLQNVK